MSLTLIHLIIITLCVQTIQGVEFSAAVILDSMMAVMQPKSSMGKMEQEIISSGNTFKKIKSMKYNNCVEVSNYTEFPEMLNGRIKTLHPKIHAGILNIRKNSTHRIDLKKRNIPNIDLVIVDLYPFEKELEKKSNKIIEYIDIGGPTLIRAAAKNFNDVTVVSNINDYFQLKNRNLPILMVIDSSKPFKEINNFTNQITAPFKILNFKKKIIAVLASDKFKKSSIIKLGRYIINKNERKIIKDKLKLKLTEKEINFLILFTSHDKPLSKKFILKNLWNYSPETNTHTIETHIHRLRKKIFQKFNDNNFIKNNEEGYYI